MKNAKKAAILAAAMLMGTVMCTPAFAAECNNGNGQDLNGIAIGNVGIFDWSHSDGNIIKSGSGALVNEQAKDFFAKGTVGTFHFSNNNTINSGTGVFIGVTNGAEAYGKVGVFRHSDWNTIGSAVGAEIVSGKDNFACGKVGIFKFSDSNKITNAWIDGKEIGSIGAYVDGGKENKAFGQVGIFNNADYNTVQASQGAVITSNGKDNLAIGNVGLFNNQPYYGRCGDGISNLNSNTVKLSMGASIQGGSNNVAIGTVGSFMSFGGTMTYNQVQGTGALIQGGNNNLAIGSVGIFQGGMNNSNQINGVGAVIFHPTNPTNPK